MLPLGSNDCIQLDHSGEFVLKFGRGWRCKGLRGDQRKKRLVKAYIYDQAIDRATYDDELAGLEEALTFTSLELRDAAVEDFDMEASLGFARAVMTRTYQLWEAADPDQKRRLRS